MKSGFPIGKLFGITIRIDWSWLVIFALVSWSLSASFGQMHQAWSLSLDWSLAIGASLLFFLSVLIHELAHSLVARARGVPVRSITLFLFGGISNIQREPRSAVEELLITIVGPLTSILLGFGFLLLGALSVGTAGVVVTSLSGTISQLGPLSTILLWLGSINVLVGIFNMIPAFPLDGGRVFRSLLWGLSNNLRKATRWASWVGQGIAWLMILGGIAMVFGIQIPFFGAGFVDGVWLALIGWFLHSAAVQGYQQVVIEDLLEGVPVTRIMRRQAPAVPPNMTVDTLVHDQIMGSDDQAFPVLEGDQMIGLVTLNDVRKVPRQEWARTFTKDIMTTSKDLVIATPDEDAAEAFESLRRKEIRQIPVVDHGRMLGLLRRKDIVRWMQLQSQLG